MGAWISPPSPSARASGSMPKTIAAVVMMIGRMRTRPACEQRFRHAQALAPAVVGEVDEQDGVLPAGHEPPSVQPGGADGSSRSSGSSRRARQQQPAARSAAMLAAQNTAAKPSASLSQPPATPPITPEKP